MNVTFVGAAVELVLFLGPGAIARVLVEDESRGALVLNGSAIDAVVEDVADGGVGVGEVAVATGALFVALRGLCGIIIQI